MTQIEEPHFERSEPSFGTPVGGLFSSKPDQTSIFSRLGFTVLIPAPVVFKTALRGKSIETLKPSTSRKTLSNLMAVGLHSCITTPRGIQDCLRRKYDETPKPSIPYQTISWRVRSPAPRFDPRPKLRSPVHQKVQKRP